MRSSWQLILSLLASSILFGNEQNVSALPSRGSDDIPRQADYDVVSVEVPGLQSLSQYVCPNNDANTKRQATVPTNTTITIPKSHLRTLLHQLRVLELQCVALINEMVLEDGLAPANSTVTVTQLQDSQASSIPLASLSSAVDSALRVKNTNCCNNDTTTTSHTTIRTTQRRGTVTTTISVNTTGFATDAGSTATSFTTTSSTTVAALSTPTVESQGTTSGEVFVQSPTGSSTASAVTENPGPTDTKAAPKDYVFDTQSSKNVAVYFGQTPVTGGTTLAAQCPDPNIDIVILAFVISATDGGSYPRVNFGAACGGQTSAMAQEAPGLLSCPQLASDIATCQTTYGKKVLLSIGGATSGIVFATPTQASNFADVLWKLFGPIGNIDLALRPFGAVAIDGFDIGTSHLPCPKPY